jgi:hypothetical protein
MDLRKLRRQRMSNAERERAIQLLEYYGEKLGCKAEFDLAIKALNLVLRLYGFKYVTTEVLLREHEVAHFDIYKRGWNDAIQAVIDASDMPVTDIIKAIKENELKEAENEASN